MQLLKLYDSFTAPQEPFKPGDLICWKPGLKDRKFPDDDSPVIVTRILAKALKDDEVIDSQYYASIYDIVIGVILNNVFYEYHMDSRRFQKYTPPAEQD